MKKILGAIAAAMLLGAGCAHQSGNTTQSDTSASPQASVESSGQGQIGGAGNAGLTCEVINGNAAGASSAQTVTNESSDAWGGSASQSSDAAGAQVIEAPATSGSASGTDLSQGTAIGGSVSEDDTSLQSGIGGSVSEDDASLQSGIGGSASEDDTSLQSGIGGSASDTAASDTAIDDVAPEADTFEDTGMGGAGGGGG